MIFMNKKEFSEIVGGVGTFLVLIAYALLNFEIIHVDLTYQFLNLFGSIGIIYTSFINKIRQPLILNIIWVFIALIGILGVIL